MILRLASKRILQAQAAGPASWAQQQRLVTVKSAVVVSCQRLTSHWTNESSSVGRGIVALPQLALAYDYTDYYDNDDNHHDSEFRDTRTTCSNTTQTPPGSRPSGVSTPPASGTTVTSSSVPRKTTDGGGGGGGSGPGGGGRHRCPKVRITRWPDFSGAPVSCGVTTNLHRFHPLILLSLLVGCFVLGHIINSVERL